MDKLFGGLVSSRGNGEPKARPDDGKSEVKIAVAGDMKPGRERFCLWLDAELLDKTRAIAAVEGLSISSIMDYSLRRSVSRYEEKHGKVRSRKRLKGDVGEVFE